MIFAKFINSDTVIRCPRNGYVGKRAISNLNCFFQRNPHKAIEEGYMEFVALSEETDKRLSYRVENNRILEEVKEDDN